MHKSFSDHGKKTFLAASIMTQQTAKERGLVMQKAGATKTGTGLPGPALKPPIYMGDTQADHNYTTTSKPGPVGIKSFAPVYKKCRCLLSIFTAFKLQILQQSG
jgi:hypothetical protein